jgi:hypothetical protein
LVGLLPSTATAIAEGAWISVVYVAAEVGLSGHVGGIGVWAFSAVAAFGMIVVRALPSGPRHDVALASLIGGAALVGWISDPAIRGVLADRQLGGLLTGSFGWLLGYAAWRGGRHRDPLNDDVVVGSLLTWVVPGLAIPWLAGSTSSDRQAFVDAALPATLLFVTAGLVAVGLTRLEALGQLVGVDWRRNRAWLSMLIGVVAIVALIGTPIALVMGVSAEASGRTLLGPAIDAVAAITAPVENSIGGLLPAGPPIQPSTIPIGSASPSVVAKLIDIVVLTGLTLVLIGLLRILGRIMTSEARPEEVEPVLQVRQIVPPPLPGGLPWLRLPRFRLQRPPAPRTASQAYLSVLGRLEEDEVLRRVSSESPAAHARRLRSIGHGSLSLDLLAADFELERYRAATLTRREVRRAIERSRHDPRTTR